jgi:hypothetical protein
MNLAAILPHGLPLSDACQLVQTTFLGVCCFRATRFFRRVFVPPEPKKPLFLQENPYFSCSSPIFGWATIPALQERIDASDASGIARWRDLKKAVPCFLLPGFISGSDEKNSEYPDGNLRFARRYIY